MNVERLENRIAPAVTITPLAQLPAGIESGHAVEFYKSNDAVADLDSAIDLLTNPARQQFVAHDDGVPTIYYADVVGGSPSGALGTDRDIRAGGAPFGPGDADDYAMRSHGFLYLPAAGTWTFIVDHNNGFRLRMGAEGAVVAENTTGSVTQSTGSVTVAAPGYFPYELIFSEHTSESYIELYATGPGQTAAKLVGDPTGRIQVFHTDHLIAPLAGPLAGGTPGHAVTFYKAVSGFLINDLDLAETLIAQPATQQFTLADNGVATINYIDNDARSDGDFGNDRDLNDIAGSQFDANADDDDFAMKSTGFIYLPQAGEWRFTVNSDDGLRLRIGGWEVAKFFDLKAGSDVNGVFSAQAPGFYSYELVYFEGGGGSGLDFSARGPGQSTNILVGDVTHGGLAVFQNTVAATPNPVAIDPTKLIGGNGFTLSGSSGNQLLGQSVAGAGDLNGDGFHDFVVSDASASAQTSFVVFGKAGGFPAGLTGAQLDGTNGFRVNAGYVVARNVGDFDRDGFDDLLIAKSDSAYLIRGHAGAFAADLDVAKLDGSNGFKVTGLKLDGTIGRQIAGAGDVNGDGFADLLLGSPHSDEGGSFRGAAYVVFGGKGPFPASFDVSTITGDTGFKVRGVDQASTGIQVAGLGDINGDGFGDIAVSGHMASGDATIFILYGHAGTFPGETLLDASLPVTTGFRLVESAGANGLGAIGTVGDVNGDGLADILVGATNTNSLAGAAIVIFGSPARFPVTFDPAGVDGTNGFRVTAATQGDFLGFSVDGAGDVNGDGFVDVLLAAPNHDGAVGADSGAAYVLYGKAGGFAPSFSLAALDPAAGFEISGVGAGDLAGISVSAAGDVNGDGFADVIVGAQFNGASALQAGQAYVVFGHATEKALTVSTTTKTAPFQIAKDGKSAIFTDPDGDLVTVKITKGALTPSAFTLHARGLGAELARLDLSSSGFAKTNVTITAKPQKIGGVLRGDGRADVGFLDALGTPLGTVSIPGTLGGFDAGDGLNGIAALTVAGLGHAAGTGSGPLIESSVFGTVKALTVKGDVSAAHVLAGSFGAVTVSGSLRAGGVDGTGFASATTIGTFAVKGGILGDSAHRVEITADGFANPTAKLAVALKSLTVAGNLEHARIAVGGKFNADAQIGTVSVGGHWIATDLAASVLPGVGGFFGDANDRLIANGAGTTTLASIAAITIKGTVAGTAAAGDSFGITAEKIGKLTIGTAVIPTSTSALLPGTTDVRVRTFF